MIAYSIPASHKDARWMFPCQVVRVIDGDTVVLDIDRGDDIHHRKRLRLLGIDAAEDHGETKEA